MAPHAYNAAFKNPAAIKKSEDYKAGLLPHERRVYDAYIGRLERVEEAIGDRPAMPKFINSDADRQGPKPAHKIPDQWPHGHSAPDSGIWEDWLPATKWFLTGRTNATIMPPMTKQEARDIRDSGKMRDSSKPMFEGDRHMPHVGVKPVAADARETLRLEEFGHGRYETSKQRAQFDEAEADVERDLFESKCKDQPSGMAAQAKLHAHMAREVLIALDTYDEERNETFLDIDNFFKSDGIRDYYADSDTLTKPPLDSDRVKRAPLGSRRPDRNVDDFSDGELAEMDKRRPASISSRRRRRHRSKSLSRESQEWEGAKHDSLSIAWTTKNFKRLGPLGKADLLRKMQIPYELWKKADLEQLTGKEFVDIQRHPEAWKTAERWEAWSKDVTGYTLTGKLSWQDLKGKDLARAVAKKNRPLKAPGVAGRPRRIRPPGSGIDGADSLESKTLAEQSTDASSSSTPSTAVFQPEPRQYPRAQRRGDSDDISVLSLGGSDKKDADAVSIKSRKSLKKDKDADSVSIKSLRRSKEKDDDGKSVKSLEHLVKREAARPRDKSRGITPMDLFAIHNAQKAEQVRQRKGDKYDDEASAVKLTKVLDKKSGSSKSSSSKRSSSKSSSSKSNSSKRSSSKSSSSKASSSKKDTSTGLADRAVASTTPAATSTLHLFEQTSPRKSTVKVQDPERLNSEANPPKTGKTTTSSKKSGAPKATSSQNKHAHKVDKQDPRKLKGLRKLFSKTGSSSASTSFHTPDDRNATSKSAAKKPERPSRPLEDLRDISPLRLGTPLITPPSGDGVTAPKSHRIIDASPTHSEMWRRWKNMSSLDLGEPMIQSGTPFTSGPASSASASAHRSIKSRSRSRSRANARSDSSSVSVPESSPRRASASASAAHKPGPWVSQFIGYRQGIEDADEVKKTSCWSCWV